MIRPNKTIAIVTGASSGLGRQFVFSIAEKYPDLDEIWVIARRELRLLELAKQIKNTHIIPIALNLIEIDSFNQLIELLEEEQPFIKILINNAGYEKTDYFSDISYPDIINTIDVNINALTLMQKVCLPYMQKGCYTIMTCSASSFAPIVGQAVYSASKKYVYYLGRALREELKPRGINILVLCCGNMDTEMNPKASAHKVSAFLPFLDLKRLTINALDKAENGYGVYTMGFTYKLLRVIGKLFPSAAIMRITKCYFP